MARATIDNPEEPEDNQGEETVEEPTPVEQVLEPDEDGEWDSYSMPPDEELWPGGPNYAQINAWKDQYGDVYVTAVTHEKNVVWRTLNRFEYRRMVKQLEQAVASGQVTQGEANMNNEEAIAELCILFPPYNRANPVGEMAGKAATISQQVMEASGFSVVEVRQL